MGPENSKEYLTFKDTLEKNHIPVVHLHKGNFSKHIPNVTLAEGTAAVVDVTAGVLFADRALKTAQVRCRLWLTFLFNGSIVSYFFMQIKRMACIAKSQWPGGKSYFHIGPKDKAHKMLQRWAECGQIWKTYTHTCMHTQTKYKDTGF